MGNRQHTDPQTDHRHVQDHQDDVVIQKLITRPQDISGCSVSICGPGWMPWIMSAPMIKAIVTLRESRHRRDEGCLGLTRVGRLRSHDALDRAGTRRSGVLEVRFERIA